MTYFLEFLNNVAVPLLVGLALPVLGLALLVFFIILLLKKGRPGGAWLVIGVPILFYALLGLFWMLANIVGGTTAAPPDNLLPRASYED